MRVILMIFLYLLTTTANSFAQGAELPFVIARIDLDDLSHLEATHCLVRIKGDKMDSFLDKNSNRIIKILGKSLYLISSNFDASSGEVEAIFLVNNDWKLSSELSNSSSVTRLIVHSQNMDLTLSRLNNGIAVLVEQRFDKGLVVIEGESLISKTLSWPEVDFIQPSSKPLEEANILSHDLSVNRINWLHHNRPTLSGSGIDLAFKEMHFDANDLDLWQRSIISGLEASEVSTHATAMASIAAGAGNSSPLSKGAAFRAGLVSSSFENTLPDPDDFFISRNLDIQNHSYGVDISNEYDAIAAAYDIQSNTNPQLLHVFSAGNSGLITPTSGQYADIGTVANLTGGLKMGKNILTVGALDINGNVGIGSSRGPAYDGRVKPELMAYGKGGTSEAAALVSGTTVLLKQAYEDIYFRPAESAMLKSVLIAGADPVSLGEISYISGFGKLNAKKSLDIIEQNQLFNGEVISNSNETHGLLIPADTKRLRVALVWNDPAANAGDFMALRNDLNLTLVEVASNQVTLPWVLDPTADFDKLSLSPVQKVDTLNNVELITIDFPIEGEYRLIVSVGALTGASQNYHIAYFIELEDEFEWTFPTGSDVLEPGILNILRFENSYEVQGALSVKYGDGDWEPIGMVEDATQLGYSVPDYAGLATLKADFGTASYISDQFVVSPEIDLQKDFLCGDELLFSWPVIENATQYQLSRIDESGYLEVVTITSDTSIFLNRNSETWNFDVLSIRPIIQGKLGRQAQVYNFENDGIGCYFNMFTASINNATVSIRLNLSTSYNVEGISFEKWNGTAFESISNQDFTEEESFTFDDLNDHSGYFTYRANVQLKEPINGLMSSATEPQELAVILPETIAVFPNPIRTGEDLNLLSAFDNAQWLSLLDAQGNRVKVVEVVSTTDSFSLKGIKSGFYIYQLISETNQLLKSGKLIIE